MMVDIYLWGFIKREGAYVRASRPSFSLSQGISSDWLKMVWLSYFLKWRVLKSQSTPKMPWPYMVNNKQIMFRAPQVSSQKGAYVCFRRLRATRIDEWSPRVTPWEGGGGGGGHFSVGGGGILLVWHVLMKGLQWYMHGHSMIDGFFSWFYLLAMSVGQRLCINFYDSRANFLTTLCSHLDVTYPCYFWFGWFNMDDESLHTLGN